MIILEDMPIVEGLNKYIEEGITSFHMPGHKNNKRGFDELNWIQKNLYKIDNTEVSGLDNLHKPEEMILDGEISASRAFKSNRSYFLVNGSTCGVYSMILGVTRPGDKIIVQRNCHKSVFTACLLGDLDTAYINPTILDDFNIAVSLNVQDAVEAMDNNIDAKAVVITYPTFYGTCMDLEKIVCEAHKRNMLVLVDEAHGAHSYFSQRLPKGAMECGADAAVTSLHKTTPSLTQTAILNTGNIKVDGIEFMLRAFQSTSPSYVFMASMDAARHIMEQDGARLIDELLQNVNSFREKLSGIPYYKILGNEDMERGNIFDIDPTKIVIKSPIGGVKLDKILREKYRLQVEMSDVNNILALTSIGNDRESFDRLYNALYEIGKEYECGLVEGENSFHFEARAAGTLSKPSEQKGISMRAAYYSTKRRVKLMEASGMISCEMVLPYPPGIPVLLPGEIITDEIIEEINFYKNNGIHINGLSDRFGEYINTAVL